MRKNAVLIANTLLSFFFLTVMVILFLLMMTSWSRAEPLQSRLSKDTEYQVLKKKIGDLHNEALVKENAPFFVKDKDLQKMSSDFKGNYCEDLAKGPSRTSKCDHRLWNFIFDRLADKYYDADSTAILGSCHFEPVVCLDFESLELMFRSFHNKGVEASRWEKLKYLEAWKEGKMSDGGLAGLLGFDFRNGTLTTSR